MHIHLPADGKSPVTLIAAEAGCVSQVELCEQEISYDRAREGLHEAGRSVILWGKR